MLDDLDNLRPNDAMQPFEKEEVFAEQLHALITKFSQEYKVTYIQIVGTLEVVKQEMIKEAFLDGDEEDDEPEEV